MGMRMVTLAGAIFLVVVGIAPGASAGKGDPVKGKEAFAQYCAACHGPAGKGDGPAAAALNPKPKDMTDKGYMSKLNDDYLFKVTSKGGAAVGKSAAMPPFEGNLKEKDIRNIIAFVRSLAK